MSIKMGTNTYLAAPGDGLMSYDQSEALAQCLLHRRLSIKGDFKKREGSFCRGCVQQKGFRSTLPTTQDQTPSEWI